MPEIQRELCILASWEHTEGEEADASARPHRLLCPQPSSACLPIKAAIWQPFPRPWAEGPLQEHEQLGCFGSQKGRSDEAIQA